MTVKEQVRDVDVGLARHGGLSFLQIPARDSASSAAFYERLLGWNVEERNPGDFRFEDATGHLIGRWVSNEPAREGTGFVPYFYVNSVADAVKRAEAGGTLLEGPRPEGTLTLARVRDPAGNVIGLWQA